MSVITAGVLASALLVAPVDGGGVLGPDGYKALHLGQPEAVAESTGLLVDKDAGSACHLYHLHPDEGQTNVGSGVFADPALGLVMIGGTAKSHTPEGITLGSREFQVRRAYPNLEPVTPVPGVFRTPVPAHPDRHYRFAFHQGRVTDFALESTNMGTC
ncbi:hypothetical protein [Amycolatopsis albispora]|uniref:Uncharacterized protein n=1 Tax=Amycolatopsis albispora TaxID=1804986 RepID=A0A344LCF6_9PSEU|nr:hypothetical protein [Amycolatopsis albispora]AXB45730.1 hypothetical protein A4R43_27265 [Amycolatopsis albispora]